MLSGVNQYMAAGHPRSYGPPDASLIGKTFVCLKGFRPGDAHDSFNHYIDAGEYVIDAGEYVIESFWDRGHPDDDGESGPYLRIGPHGSRTSQSISFAEVNKYGYIQGPKMRRPIRPVRPRPAKPPRTAWQRILRT